MIPRNITRDSVIKAIKKIDLDGVPKGRESTKYNLRYMGKLYPPKYTISLANLFENGREIKAEDFSGGKETNTFLTMLGFEITDTGQITESRSKNETYLNDNVNIATVAIESSIIRKDKNLLLEDIIKQVGNLADVILLPAGFYSTDEKCDYLYSDIECTVKEYLDREGLSTTICVGVDGYYGNDQIALAINNKGIISIGRKFYPTEEEAYDIDLADDYLSTENGYSRIFDIKGKKLYLAVCYDGFGIRKKKLSNPGVDGILNLVHGFYPHGEGGSGEVYFAKYSFAGSSSQWKCPTFGAATFFRRDIPEKWPTGVLWNQGDKNVQNWKYSDNPISPIKQLNISTEYEKATINIYSL